MKLKALLLLLLAALLPLAAPRTAHARADVSFDYFYDALLPYGEWIEVTGHGFCWRPTDVDADWAPYADGYWAFTDAGWTWVGYEEFAGIVYHYGRWLSVEGEGWCWVPDYEWGPGWVSWRKSDDYVGWAPLSPRAHWQPEIGISVWVDTVCDIGPAFYSFCRVRDFGAPVLRPVLISRERNVTIIRSTVNITNITYNTYGDSPVIYNGGPSYTFISSRSERPVPTLKLVRTTHFERADFRRGPGGFSPNARTVGNQLLVNAPVVAPPEQPAFLQDKVKKTFAADKVRDGWAGVKDAKVRDDLRQHFRRETKGLTPDTAPAKAVVAADLKVVPAQADPNAVPPVFTGKGPRGKGDRQPPVTGAPVVPAQVANPVADTVPPATTPDPRAAGRQEREKGRGKSGDATVPPAVTGAPLKPFNPVAAATPPPATPPGADPRAAEKTARENGHPKQRDEQPPAPVVVAPPVTGQTPAPGIGAVEPRAGRGPKPAKDGPVVDPAAAREKQAAEQAATDAREQANIQQQKADSEKLRVKQAEADKARGAQERTTREREADTNAAALRQKQAAEAAAATQKKQLEAQRDAEAGRQAEMQRQQADAQAKERQRAQQEQIAGQQRKFQIEQQRAAQETARQQAAMHAREQQAEQQRAAQDAAKQQAAEQHRQQQAEQQKAAQEAGRQQAEQQRRATEAPREQATHQQAQPQRGAQQPAAQPAQDPRRSDKEKDKDKDKGR